ncbi:MAG: cellobiose phosphorylase [Candidatus Omnitrophica bacterium]|nr:cellobiose phosphorylase [Candidatus Omnitrophota bacterium]
MKQRLWNFTDRKGSFQSDTADTIKTLYFPLCNEILMSSVSPDLHGDIKTNQNSFLLTPVSRQDLIDLRSSRNFWVCPVRNTGKTGRKNKISNEGYIDKDNIWSATGVSKNSLLAKKDEFKLEAGLLWHKVIRKNSKIGLKAEILSFVPRIEPVEVMQVTLTNISSRVIKFVPTAAIPVYARGANNLRDHRHVTSLLHRISVEKYGVFVKPTLIFDEAGHQPNQNIYFVLGWDEKSNPPQYIYPTQEMFCGEGADLEAPQSVLENYPPNKRPIQGKEAMGALRFASCTLKPGKAYTYIVIMGITENRNKIKTIINKFRNLNKVNESWEDTKKFWVSIADNITIATQDSEFDNWFGWVSVQPMLRTIFGCSFLPDFDYGKGGRGWRDLWQDCLVLILNEPSRVRSLLINNFSGVRIDGSNATIIGKKEGEFISDRNNISRVWMDHGVWPLLTLDLYMQETGDFDILLEETGYFQNRKKGTILEHLLLQNLVQFLNVGAHNHIRLQDADWNDGLDMAKELGESVAFSCMYAHNLRLLSELLIKLQKRSVKLAEEIKILLKKINYKDTKSKLEILDTYFNKTKSAISGKRVGIDAAQLAEDLREKSEWMIQHIRNTEWLDEGFFNGYYDNDKKPVEGIKAGKVRMILTSQVFAIMSGVATRQQIKEIIKSAKKYLYNKELKGYHLNTDFGEERLNLGRAFSFVYGDKENGTFFNHMIVMFSYALYTRKFNEEAWRTLNSIYNMAIDTEKSKIYPCLPEYFNLEGRGMYSYLTGSASWFVLTLLTQVFGVKGKNGDLLIEPKLCLEQLKASKTLSIERNFSGRRLCVNFHTCKTLNSNEYKIIKLELNGKSILSAPSSSVLISRKTITALPKDLNALDVTLG